MLLWGKNSKRAQRRKEQDDRLRQFQEHLKEEPIEKNDFLAMVFGAFWALWPVLGIVAGIILIVMFFFFR